MYISEEELYHLLYILESDLELYGFGEEYNKIVHLIQTLGLKELDLSSYRIINSIVNPPAFTFKRGNGNGYHSSFT